VDVEGFGDLCRTSADQVAVRDGLYDALSGAFARSAVRWEDYYREDRGDGVMVLVPPQVPKTVLVTRVPQELAAALAEHNRARGHEARIRLRMSVHAQEIVYDRHRAAAAAVNHAFRLLEAEAVKRALGGSRGVLAVIVSRWFFEEVVRHDPACGSVSYRQVQVSVKETQDSAWICLPDDPYPPQEGAWLRQAPEVAIITWCARLPLALAIVAARAVAHPGFPLVALAREPRDARGSLDAFHGGEVTADARAVFSWSYEQLSPDAARLFRLLGLHPGPGITAAAAASLADVPEAQARPWLAELARAHLLAEQAPGRFSFHDLLRAYASELGRAHDPAPQRQAALHRMLDHYLHTAHTAAGQLSSRWDPVTLAPSQAGVTPQGFARYAAAWAWFEAEYPVLRAAIKPAAALFDTHAWQLPWTMVDYFERQGHWLDWSDTHQTALAAARGHGGREGQARARVGLGRACQWLGQVDESRTHLWQALRLFDALGDPLGQALAHVQLSMTSGRQGRLQEGHTPQALALARAAGNRRAQATALGNIGWFYALVGDPHQALTHCEQALALKQDISARHLESAVLDSIGYAHYQLGHYEKAISYIERSLALSRELADRHSQATELAHLGDAHHAAGNASAARASWRKGLNILGLSIPPGGGFGVGYPSADQIRAKLAADRHEAT
jgi:tetratricopeptide (TPR) repeat protein